MQPQSDNEYKQLLSEVIKKQIVILGPDITLVKARNVKGLVVSDDGTVTEITGSPQEITQNLIDQFVQLSGLIVKKTMEPLLSYHPSAAEQAAASIPTIPSVTIPPIPMPTPAATPIPTLPVEPPMPTAPVQTPVATPIPVVQPVSTPVEPPMPIPTPITPPPAPEAATPIHPLLKDTTPGGPPPMDATMIQEQIDQITKGGPLQ